MATPEVLEPASPDRGSWVIFARIRISPRLRVIIQVVEPSMSGTEHAVANVVDQTATLAQLARMLQRLVLRVKS